MAQLRAPPALRPAAEALRRLAACGIADVDTVYASLAPLVRRRCEDAAELCATLPEEALSAYWRKGFAYAVHLADSVHGSGDVAPTLMVFPGATLGTGGLVEPSFGVLLRRPEDRFMALPEARQRSATVWSIAQMLRCGSSSSITAPDTDCG